MSRVNPVQSKYLHGSRDITLRNATIENLTVENVTTDNLTVDNVQVNEDLSTTGNVSVDGTLDVQGKSTVTELCATSDVSVDGTFDVEGKSTVTELCATGDVSVDGTTVLKGNLIIEKTIGAPEPVIVCPMENIPLTPAPILTNQFTDSVDAQGITLTRVSQGPWYFSDKESQRVLQCGIEDIGTSGDTPSDVQLPDGTTNAQIRISPTDNNKAAIFDLHLGWATETNFDFINVLLNGNTIFSATGNNTNATYRTTVLNLSIQPTDNLIVQFTKDSVWRGGFDSIYFYIKNLVLAVASNSVTIETDVEIIGQIKNCGLETQKYCPPPPEDEIFDLYKYGVNFFNFLRLMEDIEVVEHDVKPKLVSMVQPIFGYNSTTGDLELNSGIQYTSELTTENKYRVKYHASSKDQLTIPLPDIQACMDTVVSFYTERGYQVPSSDTFPTTENIYSMVSPDIGANFQFQYDSNGNVEYLDLSYIIQVEYTANPTIYDENGPPGDNNFSYPFRIPVTTNIEEFCRKKGIQPIVFYDTCTRQITVDYIGDHLTFFNNNYIYNYDVSGPVIFYMNKFKGKFAPIKRDRHNHLVSSTLQQADTFVQISDIVSITSTVTIPIFNAIEVQLDLEIQNKLDGNDTVFNGMVLNKMNGGTGDFDIYILNLGFANGFALSQLPSINLDQNGTPVGNNIYTPVNEVLACPTSFTAIDGDEWFEIARKFDFLASDLKPEEMSTASGPVPIPNDEFYITLLAHEFYHNVQIGTGPIRFTDSEAQPTGVEMIPELNKGVILNFRPPVYAEYMFMHLRGEWGLFSTPTSEYGAGVVYNYLFEQVDQNQQILRRTLDILSTVWCQKLKNIGVTDIDISSNLLGRNTKSNTPMLLSMQQAMDEITSGSKNLPEVYHDYAVASSLLRNNGSIPDKYKTHFPYWICSNDYPFNEVMEQDFLIGASSILTSQNFTQPAVNDTVVVYIDSFGIFNTLIIVIEGSGIYELVSFDPPGFGSYTLRLLVSFVPAGTIIPAGTRFIQREAMYKWWSIFDTNAKFLKPFVDDVEDVPVESYYDNFIPVLDTGDNSVQIDLRDCTSKIYQLDGVSSVSVAVTKGTYRVSVVRFTPSLVAPYNGTFEQIGPFNINPMDPPQVFDITTLMGAGLTKLIVSNCTITDWSGTYGDLGNISHEYLIDEGEDLLTGNCTLTIS